ncbi:hypothetical protein LMG28727_07028 [Paraburkholderia kirstenboschensis]|uniref:hypothetical protein n=1 Tax=Paraburkholderia kirstenboschensis TaxID=1245436 RepID=UPI000B0E8FBB|nr:hypothetical protein [Paraburkholderia kirstenboschensis]CAD6560030.1 hypothetical protein LMG28727_07028 [Paraburkholderia kirstenboschensis]
MLDESEPLTLELLRELEVWTCAWYDKAIAANFVRSAYHPDAKVIKLLQGYYHAGLSPAEAAEACFGRRH